MTRLSWSFRNIFIYKLSLDLLYYYGISPFYSYMGMVSNFNIERYLLGSLILFLIVPLIHHYHKAETLSNNIILMINYIYFIPGITYISFSDVSFSYIVYYTTYWVFMLSLVRSFSKLRIRTKKLKESNGVFYLLVLTLAITALFFTGYYNGFRLKFSLSDIYTIRAQVAEYSLPLIVRYLRTPAAIIIPIGILFFLEKKKYIISTSLILIQLALFGFGANKQYLLILIVSIGAYYFYNENRRKWIIISLTSVNILAVIESTLTGKISIVSNLIQRRVMFLTNNLSHRYFDFFMQNEPDYLRQSFLRHFGFESPYSLNIAREVSWATRGATTNANNGMVGDAVANFGWYGLLVYPILFALLLVVINHLDRKVPSKVSITGAVIVAFTFIDKSFFTSLLSGGVIIFILALATYPSNGSFNEK